MIKIYIDADACPVRDETYKVAARYQLKVLVVANKAMRVPDDPLIRMVVVAGSFDAADDWIVENAGRTDIVITTDILLADRCVKKSVRAISPKGEEFTDFDADIVFSSAIFLLLTTSFTSIAYTHVMEQIKNPLRNPFKVPKSIQDIKIF